MKKLYAHLVVFSLLAVVFGVLGNVALAEDLSGGIDLAPENNPVFETGNINPNNAIKFIINILLLIGVVASLIWLIIGGVKWIISGGDKGKVDAARSQIVAAIVGLIIVVLAYFIIDTVLRILTGEGLQNFDLPSLSGDTTR